ncbi:hypothetical protein [Burkholderia contaminans]|uniref:hypothetical protein n=1 Tax=Burkholderia contaminans TaxID=488447 RepID=UPI00158F10E3|nr:hypothetical protein [Burkholderia contaminans]
MNNTNKEINFTDPQYVAGIADLSVEHGSKTWVTKGEIYTKPSKLFILDSVKDYSEVMNMLNSGNYSAEDSEDDGYHD